MISTFGRKLLRTTYGVLPKVISLFSQFTVVLLVRRWYTFLVASLRRETTQSFQDYVCNGWAMPLAFFRRILLLREFCFVKSVVLMLKQKVFEDGIIRIQYTYLLPFSFYERKRVSRSSEGLCTFFLSFRKRDEYAFRMRCDRFSIFRETRSVCMFCLDNQGTMEQDWKFCLRLSLLDYPPRS